MTTEQQVIRALPPLYTEQMIDIPWEQVFHNWLRKPRSVTYSQFLRMLPTSIGEYLQVEELTLHKERLQAMVHWGKVYALELIE